ncbi:MAG: tRNA (N(6)-L-threonylcarbamoyladenosine(37)-C(2))-methylthiotransferase MtaB [Lachnospiraceae bacterium]|nr:tRNA (N(6)-L-threonylcarbamoyladenosine(37)-C(2))-methylthiotransferase MtaB [Lachnospiraceae bacterium]
MKKAAFHNLGCKVNAYETDVMEEELVRAGYEIVPFEDAADVYIINTCTVTNIADRKSRQMINRAKRKNPDAIVVAVGCYVQTSEGKDSPDDMADIRIGNNEKGRLAEIIEDYKIGNKNGESEKTGIVDDLRGVSPYEDMQLGRISEHTRAYIKIQDGCNQFCSYCIIPMARGRVRSRKEAEILKEIEGLVKEGCREFIITGIHISSYGTDFDIPGKIVPSDTFGEKRLLGLLEAINAIPGVERIRLGSLEPRIMTESFVETMAGFEKICPHFHLSLQSGSDTVLKRMNRHYDTAEYLECVERLRKHFDDPAITTDIIVGFPGETEEEFGQTLEFAEKVGFFEIHIFKYSKRHGTVAAGMKGQLTENLKSERSDRLEEVEKKLEQDYRDRHKGKRAEVLWEEEKEEGGIRFMTGHTREYIEVKLPIPEGAKWKSGDISEITL